MYPSENINNIIIAGIKRKRTQN